MSTDYYYSGLPSFSTTAPSSQISPMARQPINMSPSQAAPQGMDWRCRRLRQEKQSWTYNRRPSPPKYQKYRDDNATSHATTAAATNTASSNGQYNATANSDTTASEGTSNNGAAGPRRNNDRYYDNSRYPGNRYNDKRHYGNRYYVDPMSNSYDLYYDAPNLYYDGATPRNNYQQRNGYNFQGSNLVVEPSVASTTKKRNATGCKVFVSNVPQHMKPDDFHTIILAYGSVVNLEKTNSRDASSGQSFIITTETLENAQSIVQNLNQIEYDGVYLKADYMPSDGRRRRGQRAGMAPLTNLSGSNRQTDFPLRILVQSDMVGAIIGRQGSTIRQITQQSRARVDVHRKENMGSLEKAITIYGNPENCTSACKRILEVMHVEATNTNKGEITLKILAHNNLIGRIIGKGGQTIKRIMSDTESKITVSSINDISSFSLERIITVKGSIDNMSKAEAMISQKLRQSYENDLQAMAPQSLMFPGLHPMAMMSTANMSYNTRNPTVFNAGHNPFPFQGNIAAQPGPASDAIETAYLYIPNSSVGAIIGTKGSHIRNIIRFSTAIVKIAQLESDKPIDPSCERRVTITGTAEAQWKAQYLIYEKMREEGFAIGSEDVRLTVEIHVPSAQVGRIIGKGGQNVRELQRVTGSIIKLSEQISNPSENDETTVHIIGPFFSVQSAQRRIRSMVTPTATGAAPPASNRSRNTSQEGGARSRRDGSSASQSGGAVTPQQQQQQQASSQSSPSSRASSGQPQSQQQQQQQPPQQAPQ